MVNYMLHNNLTSVRQHQWKKGDASMNAMDKIMLNDLHRKNGLVFKAIVAVSLLTVLAIVGLSAGQGFTISSIITLLGQVATIAILGFLHYTRRWTTAIPYIAITCAFGSTMITAFDAPNLSSYFAIYYMLALAVIYMRLGPFLLGVVYGILELVWLSMKVGDKLAATGDSMMTPIIYFVLVSMMLFFLVRGSSYLFKEIATSATEAERLASMQEDQRSKLLSGVSVISDNMEAISKAGDENGQSFEQMNTSFREIATGASDQAQSSVTITEAVQSTNLMIQRMTTSFQSLLEKADKSNAHSVEGGEKIDGLYGTITDFQSSIAQMAANIEGLNTTIREVADFSSAIQEIATQTNLLSLNASIEAARAGESGQGFAVVASEIRKLAESAGRSAEQISTHLTAMEQQAGETGAMMGEVAQKMDDSSQLTKETRNVFSDIESAIGQLTDSVRDFDEFVQSLRQSSENIESETQGLVAVNEQASATLQELSATVETLLAKNNEIVDRLKQTDQAVKLLLE